MQLTLYTDYSLRTLLYLGIHHEGATISAIAEAFGISRNHLVKVVHNLGRLGYIRTTRGKSGGLHLARAPEVISIGELVRKVEHTFNLVECFDRKTTTCPISGVCRLEGVLHQAHTAFMRVLDGFTLRDLIANADELSIRLDRRVKSKSPITSRNGVRSRKRPASKT